MNTKKSLFEDENMSASNLEFASGFSILDRDEKQCLEQWGLPFENTERSLTGIEKSDLSINFMPENDTLFNSLISNESFSPNFSFQNDVPSITKIAQVLKNMPENSNAMELMDNILYQKNNIELDFSMIVTAGIAMTANFIVEDIDYEFEEFGSEIDMIIKKLKPTCLQILARSRFVGIRYYKLKSINNTINLRVESLRNELEITPLKLEFDPNSSEKLYLHNKNSSTMKIEIKIKDESKYYVEKINQKMVEKTLKSNEKINIDIISLNNDESFLEVNFANTPDLKSVKIQCAKIPLMPRFKVPKNVDELSIESTSSCLVWSCVKLEESSIQKCFIRNTSKKNENLILSTTHKSFMFDTNKGQVLSMNILLEPNKMFEIKIIFTPKSSIQFKESILIKREINDGFKKLIPLFAFGGKGNLLANKIAFDFEKNSKKILINETNLMTNFSLENNGDGISFFMIEPLSLDASFLQVTPKLGILSPGQKIDINIKLVSKININDKSSEVKVSTIIITQGDEPTRLRLKRLYLKYKSSNSTFFKPFINQIIKLISFPSQKSFNETHLKIKDPLMNFAQLYKEGIKEWQIDVVANNQILQNIKMDKEFMSLDATMLPDETLLQLDSVRLD